mmetsp:Transcript_7508/g.17203  ORF Transcript_7508/g.17203 Transcript_7508/m.17203 type:complete len:106 (+) Transcript_7508:1165-1482(+)
MALLGTLSSKLGNLRGLVEFRIRGNYLTGEVPTKVVQLTNLRVAWFQMNQFNGSVPSDLCLIRGPGSLEDLRADCSPPENPKQACECCTGCCNRITGVCSAQNET